MKRFLLTLLFLLSVISGILASPPPDEGMWLPIFIQRLNYSDMQKEGLKLTAEEIYSINNSSLKDGVVIFGGGCTGEMISPEGLLLTNHHCGFDAIQSHSSVEHDYLSNGFWAKSFNEELPCPGLTVRFLVRIEDVTARILDSLQTEMPEPARQNKILLLGNRISKQASDGGKYKTYVRSFFEGNEYYLFVYEEYSDVRLVGAPPASIGKFGGETDNWMWPRHTGDFSMFRVYMSPDGKPAKYDIKNVPFKPKHFFPISLKGYKKGDYAMIMGYPGRTQRYMTSYGIEMALNISNPSTVKIRTKKLELMKKDMNSADSIRIKYASKYAGTANYWKYYMGQSKGLKKLKVVDKKKALENEFVNWVSASTDRQEKYSHALDTVREAYEIISKYQLQSVYFMEAVFGGSELFGLAYSFDRLYSHLSEKVPDKAKISKTGNELKSGLADFYKDYNLATDKKLFIALLQMYFEDVPVEQQPEHFRTLVKKYRYNFSKLADNLYSKSIFPYPDRLSSFCQNPSKKVLDKDPFFKLMKAFLAKYREYGNIMAQAQVKLAKGNRLFVAGLREMQPDRKFYPDANSTMRLTYGTVEDYFPADAIYYSYYTTLDGVIQKEDPNNDEFTVPEKLKELYQSKDFGRYGEMTPAGDIILKTCFLTNNDITGGNSGSPVLDGNGNLIGIAFDGNWDAMSGNMAFEPELQRTINVDIRYVLFIIDKFANAQNLIDEMKIEE